MKVTSTTRGGGEGYRQHATIKEARRYARMNQNEGITTTIYVGGTPPNPNDRTNKDKRPAPKTITYYGAMRIKTV